MLDAFAELECVIATLEEQQIPYALCGGLAVGVYAEPRATKDIDILLLAEDVERVKRALLPCGFKFFSTPMFFADSHIELHKMTKIVRGTGDYIFLDLLVSKAAAATEIWNSRQRLPLGNRQVWVVSRDWLIWMKKLRSSYQDLSDIENMERSKDGTTGTSDQIG